MASFTSRKGEYATSTDRVRDLRRWKDDLYQRNMPKHEVNALVDQFYRRPAYAHLENRNPVFLVTPSTTGKNKLPYYFAKRLQSEVGGDVVVGWAAPLERQKASVKGGLGKMRNPAKFAALNDKLAMLPKDRPLVLVDDVITTGETTDALRELLEQQGHEVTSVASLGQSEMRKVSQRDIDRITDKLGDPSLKPAVTGVLQGRLKHKANYIERVIHEDTRPEIRDYFRAEHRRLQGLGTVQQGRTRGLRRSHPSHRGLQLQGSVQTTDPGGSESETGPSAGHATGDGERALAESQAELVFRLEELQEMVRRGMEAQQAREYAMDHLGADKIRPAPKMFLNHELTQALKGEKGAKPYSEIVQYAHEMQVKPSQKPRPQHTKRRIS